MNHFLSFPSSFFPIVSASIFTPFLAVAIDIGTKSNLYFPIGYRKVCKKNTRLYRHCPLKNEPRKRLCLLSQTTLRFEPTSTKKFSPLPLRLIKLIPYLCSLMKYLNKPSEKIICTESIGSFTLNFQRYHIDGQTVGRLFFVQKQKLNTYVYVNVTEKTQPHLHQRLHA